MSRKKQAAADAAKWLTGIPMRLRSFQLRSPPSFSLYPQGRQNGYSRRQRRRTLFAPLSFGSRFFFYHAVPFQSCLHQCFSLIRSFTDLISLSPVFVCLRIFDFLPSILFKIVRSVAARILMLLFFFPRSRKENAPAHFFCLCHFRQQNVFK